MHAVVIMGDLNADPADGDGRQQAIQSLLGHLRLQDPMPASEGGHRSDPRPVGTKMVIRDRTPLVLAVTATCESTMSCQVES